MLESARRLATVLLAAVLVSAALFGVVQLSGTSSIGRRANIRERWSKVEYSRAPGDIALQIAIVAGIAIAGRKLLGLRL